MCFSKFTLHKLQKPAKKKLKSWKDRFVRHYQQKKNLQQKTASLLCVFFLLPKKLSRGFRMPSALEARVNDLRHMIVTSQFLVEELKQRECRFDVSGTWVVTSLKCGASFETLIGAF